MPLYDYECVKCGKVTEVRHGFNDTYAQPCAACGGALKRVINPAPIIFKGSGFYVTDSRKNPAKTESASPAPAKPDSAPSPQAKPSGESAA
ncbi:MAG TPA: FmdB family zinc ribbon protein [Candidatus Baltobacteraceae bacterium]|jgi:putative FmdB family regulatory protein|nr:FmdB family zinc ribbon protein [Candidatus Baltobacteraceae bacterium]